MDTINNVLNKIYYNIDSPAIYSGVNPVLKEAKKVIPTIKTADVENFLQEQDVYTLHKPARMHFPRNRVVARWIDSDWQADLCDMVAMEKANDGIRYLLTVIDVLSKFAWVAPVKRKTPEAVRDAFASILKGTKRRPGRLFTDQGKEFVGKPFQAFLESKGISSLTSRDPKTKASVAERYNRTLKTRLWKHMTHHNTERYIDILPKIVAAINHSYHRMIKMRPVDVTAKNEKQVLKNLYGKKEKIEAGKRFEVGDKVRISKYKHIFEKGYLPNYTEEVFTIYKVVERKPIPVYRLKDYAGEKIEGVFYGYELSKVRKDDDKEVYKIEKVLKSRRKKGGVKEVLVKWRGYPAKFNQWIPETDLVHL